MQLIRNQLKREFGKGTWSRGVQYDREGRVKDVVTEGEPASETRVIAKVLGSEEVPYETSIMVERGLIKGSRCSCPAHGVYDTHCKHVAALTHWVMSRSNPQGQQPRPQQPRPHGGANGQHQNRNHGVPSGVGLGIVQVNGNGQLPNPLNNRDRGKNLRRDRHRQRLDQRNEQRQKNLQNKIPREPLKATPITFVNGLMEGEKQVGITIEPGLRYKNEKGEEKVVACAQCRMDTRDNSWLAPDKRKLIPSGDKIPFLNSLFATKMVYTGNMSVHMMSTLMSSSLAANIVFDESLKLDVAVTPLKIGAISLGKKSGASRFRELTFELKNDEVSISSEELKTLASEGRVSGNFAWLGNKLYTFERSLDWIDARASDDGQISVARNTNSVSPSDLFPVVADDESRPLHPLTAFRLGLELGAQEFQVDDEWKEYHKWLKTFERSELPSLPRVTYGFDLREYQTNGLSWMWSLYHRGLAALLADDMGLGKTHQVLAFLSSLYKSKVHKPNRPSLVVAPTSVVAAWEQKLDKYKTGLKWHTFHGKERKLPDTAYDVILTTYGILQRDDVLLKKDWHIVILDEAQAIKNPATLNARQARSLQAKFRIVMTGTPVENSITDLWSLMEFLLPGYLGSFERFKRLYVPREGMPTRDQAQTVRRLVTPFLLRRTKAQVLSELPEKTEEVRSCGLTEPQQLKYNQYLNSKEAEALRAGLKGGGKIDYVGILSILTRLKQVCDHPDLPDVTSGTLSIAKLDPSKSGKWDAFDEILTEALGSGLKVVVFTQYLAVIDFIAKALRDRSIQYSTLRGDTMDRGAELDRFANDGDCKVFLCSLLAGGMGIDLTAGSVCIHFDRWWNPAKENQATDRLHRIGQTRGVQVFKLQIPGTIEERIASIIESKSALADALVEESAVGLKTFSRQELLELLTELPKSRIFKPGTAEAVAEVVVEGQ